MKTTIIHSLSEVDQEQWNTLDLRDNPFLRHEFLNGLETHRCVDPEKGWQPCHLIVTEHGQLVGAMPMYIKSHSWGEFVFDWSWANAYEQAGLDYYPKLIVAAPFSPVQGARLLIHKNSDDALVRQALIEGAIQFAQEQGFSSVHWLFPDNTDATALKNNNFGTRQGYQFHWHNQGYRDFDHFLSTFSSAKRKNIKKERRKVTEAGVEVRSFDSHNVSNEQLRTMSRLYIKTCMEKGNHPWLNEAFFLELKQTMADNLLLFLAYEGDEIIAGAFCLRSQTHLYGRYWGYRLEYDNLHFETCYYRPIEYCIEQGIQCFEPGAQGEHKISRGFLPTSTWSAHWIAEPKFKQAIDQFLDRENQHVDEYIKMLNERSPFKQVP